MAHGVYSEKNFRTCMLYGWRYAACSIEIETEWDVVKQRLTLTGYFGHPSFAKRLAGHSLICVINLLSLNLTDRETEYNYLSKSYYAAKRQPINRGSRLTGGSGAIWEWGLIADEPPAESRCAVIWANQLGQWRFGGTVRCPLWVDPNFVMTGFWTVHLFCSCKTSKFRHSLTNKLQTPYRALPVEPTV